MTHINPLCVFLCLFALIISMHKIVKICHFANDIFCHSASYIPAHNARNERSAVHGQGQEARDFKFHSNFSFNIAVLHPL